MIRGLFCSAYLAATLPAISVISAASLFAQRYTGSDGRLRVSLAQQPLSPNGRSAGPRTMAEGGVQQILAGMGATIRVDEAQLRARSSPRSSRRSSAATPKHRRSASRPFPPPTRVDSRSPRSIA
jgi:hypothetical protein